MAFLFSVCARVRFQETASELNIAFELLVFPKCLFFFLYTELEGKIHLSHWWRASRS